MGAAVEVFEGAQAIEVPRSRFLPVKTTNELMLLRSDVYDLREDGTLAMQVDAAPVISLDSKHFKRIGDFEQRVPERLPSLREATRFTVEGDWSFGDDVVVKGDVTLPDEGAPSRVEDGAVLQG